MAVGRTVEQVGRMVAGSKDGGIQNCRVARKDGDRRKDGGRQNSRGDRKDGGRK